MAETRVDLEQLLEDLRDAYPYSLSDSILTEIITDSLDSEEERHLSDSIARFKQRHRSVTPCNGAAKLHQTKTLDPFHLARTAKCSSAPATMPRSSFGICRTVVVSERSRPIPHPFAASPCRRMG